MSDNRQNLQQWLQAVEFANYYELLGLLEICDDAAIQEAFHRFCASFHPDQHRGEDELYRQQVSYVFKRGAEAYRVLRDPELRARYDLALAQGKLRLDETVPPEAGPTDAGAARSLTSLAQTPAGRLHAGHAEGHLHRGELATALACLERALEADGNNAALAERIAALRDLLSLQGQ
jgi:curved DNA-binding protein CbpA